ncbi:MAG: hypothetical protein Q8L48_43680 [Archangium sp.]|nr:hypothetical protein [Archangium sp.]
MFALPLVMILLSASPSAPQRGVRESKVTRAARLMTDVELAQLADLDSQIQELHRTAGNTALLVGSIVAMSAGALVPVVAAAVALVGTLIVGFVGLIAAGFGSTSLLAFIPQMWVAVFAWIPVWGWIAMGVAVTVGAGMLIGALTSDAPRRAEVSALKGERSRLIHAALARSSERAMTQVPMTTLATF